MMRKPSIVKGQAVMMILLLSIGSSCLATGMETMATLAAYEGTPPNIIIIYADDMGYGDCGAYNPNSRIPTPNIDQLASEGLRFTDAHSSSNTCTPSRYGLLTGTNPLRMGVRNTLLDEGRPIIESHEATIATLLKDQGYHTKMFGKWHLGFQMDAQGNWDFSIPLAGGPLDCGFDDFYGLHSSPGEEPLFYIRGRNPVEIPTAQIDVIDTSISGSQIVETVVQKLGAPGFDPKQVSPNLCAEAVSDIEAYAQQGQRFFLYYASVVPHNPFIPTDQFRGASGVGLYGDYIMQFDDIVGQINDALKATGLDQNTLLIFTTDNGAGPPQYNYMRDYQNHDCSGGLRGYKALIYEGGHRVPFIAKWPAEIAAGAVSDATVNQSDLFATFAELTGVDMTQAYPASAQDSVSFLPVLLDSTNPFQRPAMINGRHAVRDGDWKLLSTARNTDGDALGQSKFKLYDMIYDLAETSDASASNPQLASDLYDAYQLYWSNTDAPTPNPATFASAPSADSDTAISMTATTGTDASGPVEYLFTETSGNPGGTTSAWQTSTSYIDSGLDADTQYTYTVTMRDALNNTGTASSPANATTDAAAPPQVEVTAVADTFVRKGRATENYGADEKIRTKTISGATTRVSIFRFDTTAMGDLSSAAGIQLDVTKADASAFTSDKTVYVYGVTDGSALQDFTEGTGTQAAATADGLAWNDSLAFDTAYAYDIKTDAGYFYDADTGTPGLEDPLAGFTVATTDAAGTTYNISSAAMLNFAQASADQYLTFVMVRDAGSENNLNLQWAAKENTTYDAPTLTVNISPNVCSGAGGMEDLICFAAQWLSLDCIDSPACGGADLDGDTEVTLSDFAIFAGNWLAGM
ncbi:MAG: sulfatase-like hydrolase/transferase [Planctomycetota bacterium]